MDKSKCFLSCIFLNLDLHSWEIACFHLENKGNTNTRKNRAEKLNRFPKRWKDKRTAFSKNNKFTMYWIKKKKTLWPLFIDGVQLPQARATSRRQFTFYHKVPRNPLYSFYQPWKDEQLSQPWSHPVVLSTGPLDWEFSALTTRSLLLKELKFNTCYL